MFFVKIIIKDHVMIFENDVFLTAYTVYCTVLYMLTANYGYFMYTSSIYYCAGSPYPKNIILSFLLNHVPLSM